MTKVVEPDPAQPVLLKQLWKSGRQVVGRNQVSHFIYADVLQVLSISIQRFTLLPSVNARK